MSKISSEAKEEKEEYLFSWDEIPGKQKDGRRLIGFLKKKFRVDWVKNAKIEKTDNGEIIKLTDKNNSLLLKLSDERNKVKIEINDGRTYELIAKIENGKLNIYKEEEVKLLPTPLEVVDYDFKSAVIRIGQYGRTSLNLKPEQDIYIYEDVNNLQLVLCVYELKRSMYRSIINFSEIEDFIELGVNLWEKINILSISFYKSNGKYRMTLLYEVLDSYRADWKKTELKKIIDKINANKHSEDKIEKPGDAQDDIEELDTIEYADIENERVKNIILPLIEYQQIFKRKLKSVKISKNWTIYYKLSDDFKERAKLKGADACKCIQIAELDVDVGILILKFYKTGIVRINIETLNLPGSFVRLINIFNCLDIDIIAVDLQKISLEGEGSAEIIYILKYPDKIKNKIEIFRWGNIPGNDEQRLIKFLQQSGFDWVKNAKIEKSDNDKTIKVSTANNSLLLKLNDKKDKVSLEIDSNKFEKFGFVRKTENDTVYSVNEIKNLLMETDSKLKEMYLFSWDNTPGNDNGKLIEFLIQKFRIDWVKNAKIEKSDNDKTIKVSTANNSLLLKLSDERNKVKIEINDGRTYELIAKIENGYLFSWNDIPGNDNGRLIEFLKKRFDINWVEIAKIEKTDNGEIIKLTDKNNSLLLKLSNEKTKVNLEISDGKTDELIAKTKNGKLNIYENGKLNIYKEEKEHKKIVDKHDEILEKTTKKGQPFIHDIKIL